MNESQPDEVAGMSVRFEVGDAVAIVGRRAVCLLVDDPGSDLVAALRAALIAGDGTDSPMEVMVRTGGLDLPSFGLVVIEGTQVRVVVRGEVSATVDDGDRQTDVDGARVRTWLEHVADDVRAVRLHTGPPRPGSPEIPSYEAVGGVVPARAVEIVPVASGAEAGETAGETAGGQGDHAAPDVLGGSGLDPDADRGPEAGSDPDDGPIAVPPPFPEAVWGADPEDAEPDGVADAGLDTPGTELHGATDDAVADEVMGDEVMADDAVAGDAVADLADHDESSVVDPAESTRYEPEPAVLRVGDDVERPGGGAGADGAEPVEAGVDAGAEGAGVLEPVDVDGDEAGTGAVAADAVGAAVGGVDALADHGATLVGPFDGFDEPELDEGAGADSRAGSVDPNAVDRDAADPNGTGMSGPMQAEEPGDDYDHLFGATQFRTVEQAAVRPVDEHADDGEGSGPMISGVPGGPADAPIGAGASPSPGGDVPGSAGAVDDDHDGRTVSLASLRAQLERSAAAPGTSPSVHAVHCPNGHLNPTHAGTCRVCGLGIGDQDHVSVPRPVLGMLAFTDGRVVSVSRPLLIGRAPKADGVLSGEPPELVVVASPLKEISSTHLEVRLEGWQVLVVDRQSTNGTVVTPPGRDPQRLRPGEPVPITPGTRVNLADETEFVFEVAQ